MKIGIISLGCAKNLVDTENLLGMLAESKDAEITRDYNEAECIIVNTCGFIESAKIEAINTILDVADYKEKNLKKLIVMGCLAQRYKPDLEEEFPEVDRIISLDEYDHLGDILTEELNIKIGNTYGQAPRKLSGKPWMAYLKIADGCHNQCAFCAIPYIRGPLKSQPIDEVISEAKRLVENGVKELNLIAQDCTQYGLDWDGKLHLSELLKELDEIEGVHWIRILYFYPDEMPNELIETIKNSKHVLPYFDIPIQHGNNEILKAMRRRTTKEDIIDRVQKIRDSFDHPVLRTTLIVGYPGETLEQHNENVELVKEIGWDHLGVFTYSKEENTPSYDLEDNVPEEEKQRRMEEIMLLQDEIVKKNRESWIGQKAEVMIESINPLTNMYVGRSAMFAPDGVDGVVMFSSDKDYQPGDFTTIVYTKVSGQNMLGKEI